MIINTFHSVPLIRKFVYSMSKTHGSKIMPISSFQAVLKDILIVSLHTIILYPSTSHHPTSQQLVSVYPMLHCVMAQKNAPLALMKQNVKAKSVKAFL